MDIISKVSESFILGLFIISLFLAYIIVFKLPSDISKKFTSRKKSDAENCEKTTNEKPEMNGIWYGNVKECTRIQTFTH